MLHIAHVWKFPRNMVFSVIQNVRLGGEMLVLIIPDNQCSIVIISSIILETVWMLCLYTIKIVGYCVFTVSVMSVSYTHLKMCLTC